MNNLNSKNHILFIILICSALQAINFKERDTPFPYYLWFSGGLGALITDDSDMMSLNASINYSKNTHVLKLRAIGGGGIQSPPDNDRAGDIGLLYGYRHSFGNISISYMAGTAITAGTYKGDKYYVENDPLPRYEMVEYRTIGFPLEVQLDMNSLRPFGLSISLFGDLNSEKSFVGLSANILIGRLP
jgi:hypothetical protein